MCGEMIERVARAIAGPMASAPWEDVPGKRVWEMYTTHASAAIAAHKAALAEAGLVIRPRQPTTAMQIIGNQAIQEEKSAGYVYRAMIAEMEQA